MARRLSHLVALVAVLLLTLPGVAAAAYSWRLEAPANGTVTGRTDVQVRVDREPLDVDVTGLRVRPVGGGEWHETRCISACNTRSPIFAFELDPRSGAPFARSPMSNGPFEFEGRISRGRLGDRDLGRLTLSLRVPGSAVGGLSATVDGDDVRIAWSRAPEPDITAYRVERCPGSCGPDGSWSGQGGTQSPNATSYSDRPGVGVHSYRVVTVRSNGGDGSIETVSSAVRAEIEPPPPSPSPSPSPTPSEPDSRGGDPADGGPGPGSGGDGDGTPDGSAGRPNRPSTGSAPDLGAGERPSGRTAAPEVARSPRVGGSGVRSGRAPSVSLGRGLSGIPDLPGVGEVYRGTLDYSVDDPEAADERGSGDAPAPDDDDAVVLTAPGSSGGSFVGRLTDPNRIAVPIAGGLLMTAIGLHLWRWLRIPLG